MTREEVEQICKETGITVLFADGFDDAIMGIGRSFQDYKLIYSRDKVLEILMDEHDMDITEAEEYYEYNIAGAYVGKSTPIFMEF